MATTLELPAATTSDSLAKLATQPEFWRRGAPDDILSDRQWSRWMRHLRKRRSPHPLAALCRAEESPLRWAAAPDDLTPQAVELLSLVDRLSAKRKGKSRFDAANCVQALSVWLQGTWELPQSVAFGLECLAVAQLLPAVAGEATEQLWWQVLSELYVIARSTADWRVDAEMPPEMALAQQILTGELPLTLAYLFPEIRPLYKLREAAHEALSEGLVELTNGEGLLRGPCLGILRPLLACWTRARAMGRQFKKGCWNGKAEVQFACLASQAVVLSAPNGTSLLDGPHAARWTPEFLSTVLRLGGDATDASAARRMFGKKLTRHVAGKHTHRDPVMSDNCEWSGVARMRTHWERSAPAMVVDYSSPQLRLELWSSGEKILGGNWEWETTVDGRRLDPVSAWENTCWFSDEDADYLELEIELADATRLQRQILLAREDRILLLADYVLSGGDATLGHRMRLPLDPAVRFEPEQETREGHLVTGKTLGRVLPLALPEWRSDPRVGQLTAEDGWLQLEQGRPGSNLACPLLIDLDRSRAGKPCTWRQLTVGESLEIQPHDVAVGYRAQCGKQQWLVYRSLAPPASRTVLGQNLANEFLAARFLAPSGEVDEIVEVEA